MTPTPPPNAARPLQYNVALRSSGLDPTAMHVCYIVSSYANNRTGYCYPSRAAIQKATGYAPSTITKALGRAQKAGWLHRQQGDFRAPYDTWITIPKVAAGE